MNTHPQDSLAVVLFRLLYQQFFIFSGFSAEIESKSEHDALWVRRGYEGGAGTTLKVR